MQTSNYFTIINEYQLLIANLINFLKRSSPQNLYFLPNFLSNDYFSVHLLHNNLMDKLKERRNLLIIGAGVVAGGLALYYYFSKKKALVTEDQIDLDNDKLHVINKIKNKYHISHEGMVKLKESILSEFQLGLQKVHDENLKSSIKMLPSFITRKPTGNEEGISYALDVGGTNARAIKVKLNGNGKVEILETRKQVIPDSLLKGRGEDLFDFLAACLCDVLDEGSDHYSIGFTFSFPVDQRSVNSGYLIQWTKGFTTSDVKDNDVVKLLNQALDRAGIKAEVTVLINDTVGSLIASSYLSTEHETIAGIILGTGSNAAYVERQSNIEKLDDKNNEGIMVINTEWGNFDSPRYKYLMPTEQDIILDKNSVNFSQQHFEKMISGMYLGEIVRLELLELSELSLFRHNNSETILKPYHFGTEIMSEIEKDNTSTLSLIKSFLTKLSIPNTTYFERKLLQEICRAVSTRSARLVAAAIAAIVEKVGKKDEPCVIAVDGSLYELYPGYSDIVKSALKELGFTKVILNLTKDGSGIGAAIAAAVLSKE